MNGYCDVDDFYQSFEQYCRPIPQLTAIAGEKRCSQELFEKLYEQGLQLITRHKKNMKQKLVKLIDKILLRKRSLIETVNDQLKNISQIEHSLASEWKGTSWSISLRG